MGVQVLSRAQACPLSRPASGFGPTRAAGQGSDLVPFPFLDGRNAAIVSKGLGRPGRVRGAVRGAFDGKSGGQGAPGNGQLTCRHRLLTLQQGAGTALTTSNIVTSSQGVPFISPSCHSLRIVHGESRRRRAGKVRAITTDEAYETLADLEKRLDEEGGEYDDEEYYEILPDKRRVATEPVRKIMDLSWLWLLEELRECSIFFGNRWVSALPIQAALQKVCWATPAGFSEATFQAKRLLECLTNGGALPSSELVKHWPKRRLCPQILQNRRYRIAKLFLYHHKVADNLPLTSKKNVGNFSKKKNRHKRPKIGHFIILF